MRHILDERNTCKDFVRNLNYLLPFELDKRFPLRLIVAPFTSFQKKDQALRY